MPLFDKRLSMAGNSCYYPTMDFFLPIKTDTQIPVVLRVPGGVGEDCLGLGGLP